MKKFSISALFATFCLFFMANTSPSAPAEPHFFLGKWDMLVKSLPQGDTHMHLVFEMKKDDAGKEELIGHIEKTSESDEIVFSKVETEAEKITFYFTAQGYDINVVLTKKDEDTAEGTLFNMFEAVAKREK